MRILVAVLLALLLGGCGGSDVPSESTRSASGEVVELTDLATLKDAFAEDSGQPRLLLLLSPT